MQSKGKQLLVERRMTPISHSTDGKNVYIEGIILQSNVINANFRWYPEQLMDDATHRYIEKNMTGISTAWGALDHPENPELKLADVSHRYVELEKQGTDWWGKALIGNTEKGIIAKELLNMGGTLGTSSRAGGEVDEGMGPKGSDLVTDLDFITVGDIVANPSAPNAYVTSVMENSKWILKNDIWTEEEIDVAKSIINKSKTKSTLNENKLIVAHKLFKRINEILSHK